ncbi:MAG: 2-C-methyl-D-erythritol 4-phosphate cytidylyltransferase [Endomicrobium sp.]|jgi:2-C-methyl-D-erythritol 4-phosphate cytidylyltransferase|nr:2-C-methyl-D-erythritol 4-phosphate cytidylyltransferase [Endomicrobium sp.]
MESIMKCAVIIVASGFGRRFGSKIPKQFLSLNKKPMFLWSVDTFASIKIFKQIVVVAPFHMIKFLISKYGNKFECVAGGKERYNSVKSGLEVINNDIEFVAIHDAARPLIAKIDILSILKKVTKTKAVIAVEKIKDTIKLVSNNGQILKTLNRFFLRGAQTPQIFDLKILKKAYFMKRSINSSDDAQLVENLKIKISTVETRFPNFKITTKQDFLLAEKLLKY